MTQKKILERLLRKYEASMHLLTPGTSNKRVMLRTDKKELPEYDYENAEIRDAFNAAAEKLEKEHLLTITWFPNHSVFSTLALNLNIDSIRLCYEKLGKQHPAERAEEFIQIVKENLCDIGVEWIANWRDAVCQDARIKYRLPTFCKEDFVLLRDLMTAFRAYDNLHGDTTTMRTFSSRCYHDTKYFERNVRKQFLSIAEKHNKDLAEAMEQAEMLTRDQQAFLGIYARPELYELAGNCTIQTARGRVDLTGAGKFGLAVPSTAIDSIVSFQMETIHKIIFIENKTNYDEFLLSEMKEDMLVVYHGGFLSPQKRKLVSLIANSTSENMEIYFWADIDLGGFRMFSHLQALIPTLRPMRMGAEEVLQYQETGLKRDKSYFSKLQEALEKNEFPCFEDAIKAILHCGVTIEQECFLM